MQASKKRVFMFSSESEFVGLSKKSETSTSGLIPVFSPVSADLNPAKRYENAALDNGSTI
jgi:hypothetical protein